MNHHFETSHAIIIGIDEYAQGIPSLRSAVNDAQRLGNLLETEHEYQCHTYLNADANLANLEQLLQTWLPQHVGENDRVLFYFAGHGVALDADDGPRGYLLPQDAKLGAADTYLEMSTLHDQLMSLPCRHMLIILDSCFSGAFRWSSNRDVMSVPGVVHQEAYERFITDPAWQLLTSAAHDQTAADQLSNGVLGSRGESGAHSPFAMALFNALNGDADLVPDGGDGIITATELYLYLENSLQQETIKQGRRQTPGLWPLQRHDKGEYIFAVPGREMKLPPAPPLSLENNPYQGLNAYESDNADVFFGRSAAISELVTLTQSKRLVVVLGASGSGKSSLAKAGLATALVSQGWEVCAILRPGAHPLGAFERALQSADAKAGIQQVLIIDQFEELVTMTRDADERDRFFSLMNQQLDNTHSQLHIVVTLRADFEAHFQLESLKAHWQPGRYTVPPLTRHDLKEIIEQPASERVLYFDPSTLVERLLDDVVAMPGALPLLSFTLSEMYLCYLTAQRGDRALNEQDYEALGGVAGALKTRADAEYQNLDAAHQQSLQRLMLRMMQFEHGLPVRQRISEQELLHWDDDENKRITYIVNRMCAARLLVQGIAEDGTAYVEPAHDALITSWSKLLEWSTHFQASEPDLTFLQSLGHNAQAWATATKKAKPGLLWRDKVRSDRLWALRKNKRLLLNRQEDEFCRISVRRQRIIRTSTLTSVVAIVVSAFFAIGLGIVANNQRIIADEQKELAFEQRNAAVRQTLIANSNALAASAGNALEGQNNPTLGLNIAVEALKINPDNAHARWLIRRATYHDGIMFIGGRAYSSPIYKTLTSDATEFVWSPDGQYMAVINYDYDKTTIYSTQDGSVKGVIAAPVYKIGEFSADGEYYVDADSLAWHLDGSETRSGFSPAIKAKTQLRQMIVAEGYNTAWSHAWSENGEVKAGHGAADSELDVFVQDLAEFQIIKNGRIINRVPGVWNLPALSPKGDLLATSNYDGEVVLWRVTASGESAERMATLWETGSSSDAWELKFSPDGTKLAVVMRDGILRIWDLTWNPLSVSQTTIANMLENDSASPPTATRSLIEANLDDSGSGNDTPFITINALDTVTGKKWSRNFVTGSANLSVMDDMLILESDDGTTLMDSKGVTQIKLNLQAISNSKHGSSAIYGYLLLAAGISEHDLAIPINTISIINRAQKRGLLSLSQTERDTWGVDDANTSADVASRLGQNSVLSTAQPTSVLTWIGEQLGNLLWTSSPPSQTQTAETQTQEPLPVEAVFAGLEQVPQLEIPMSSMPIVWEKIANATEPDQLGFYDRDYPGNVRWYLSNVKRSGIHVLLSTLGAPEPFVSGPHTMQDWQVWRAEKGNFGHYNPAFLSWLDQNLLPQDKDSALRLATQTVYERAIKRMMRVYAISLITLEAFPEIHQRAVRDYLNVEQSREQFILAVTKLAVASIGERPEAHSRDFAFAMGFWVRRELDGTKEQFRQLMDKTLLLYDNEFKQALESGDF
ncbi:caspase family protein [Aliiglaciecola sp. M165]|uniref:nSTAND1 domain-containing NTPase n=1 Tax=Aliiglaciecola sp. M165 TaxID=2593649 RepID=UPI00163DDD36|nr:caspase family protein [Aliiglaciecola sp. M165]